MQSIVVLFLDIIYIVAILLHTVLSSVAFFIVPTVGYISRALLTILPGGE